ncbi:MAG: hypothetical protein ACK4SA_24755 [Caldilinea sp.]
MIFGGFCTDFPNDPDSFPNDPDSFPNDPDGRIAAQGALFAFCFCLANVLRLHSPKVTVPLFITHCVE